MQIILFESQLTEKLNPITLTRASFTVRTGGATLRKLSKLIFKPAGIHIVTRLYVRKITEEITPKPKKVEDKLLFLNGEILPDSRVLKKIVSLVERGKPFCVKDGKEIVVAYFSCKEAGVNPKSILKLTIETVRPFLHSLKFDRRFTFQASRFKPNVSRFKNLWDVISVNEELLRHNLEVLSKDFKQIRAGVFVSRNVNISEHAVLDTSSGLIVIDEETKVCDYAILRGPLFIGRHCTINSFAELKDGVTIGNVCKVGGEVEASIIQGYSNKQHFGSLGHSYVGSWVNLGAGTTNSDLKNTYGEIKMMGQPTGQQFLGCVIGEYTKAAIGTMIYTGKVVGVGSMVFGAVTRDVPSFTNAGSLVDKSVEVLFESAIEMQRAMMARRKLKATAMHRQLLKDVFELTKEERKKAGVGEGKLKLR